MWKDDVQPDRPQMIIRRRRFACWITKATDTQYITLIVFPLQHLLREHASMLRFRRTTNPYCIWLYSEDNQPLLGCYVKVIAYHSFLFL